MKRKTTSDVDYTADFAVAEHLYVQYRIERRARELWVLNGCRHNRSIDEWIQAELEITAAFIRSQSHDVGRTRASQRTQDLGKLQHQTNRHVTISVQSALSTEIPQ